MMLQCYNNINTIQIRLSREIPVFLPHGKGEAKDRTDGTSSGRYSPSGPYPGPEVLTPGGKPAGRCNSDERQRGGLATFQPPGRTS